MARAHNPGRVTVLDFYAPWCIQCAVQRALLESLDEVLPEQADVRRVDVDSEPDAARRYGIQEVPTLVVLRNGVECARRVGMHPAEELAAFLCAALA